MSKTKAKIVLTPLARAIVKQAITNIKSKPDQFDMDHWVGKNKTPKALRTCGTSACLAGHLVLASGVRVKGDRVLAATVERKLGFTPAPERVYTDVDGKQYVYVSHIANQLLGVDERRGDALYLALQWPEPFNERYNALTYVGGDEEKYRAATPSLLKRRANLAVRRLRYFLKEGK